MLLVSRQGDDHPERSDRLRALYEHMARTGLLEGTLPVDGRAASEEELRLAHAGEHVQRILTLTDYTDAIGGSDAYGGPVVHVQPKTPAALSRLALRLRALF